MLSGGGNCYEETLKQGEGIGGYTEIYQVVRKKWWQWNDLGRLETSQTETFHWTIITVFGIM